MKKKLFLLFALIPLLALASCNSSNSGSSSGGDNPPIEPNEPTVTGIAVKENTVQTEFEVGDEFNVDGGILTVSYSDQTSKEVSMTLDMIMNPPPMDSEFKQYNVYVSYMEQRTSYTISISIKEPEITYLSVTEAIALAQEAGEQGTSEKQYVTGVVKSISNTNYGEMYITDGKNDLSIYGVYSSDGSLKYSEMEEKPYSGDEVFIYGYLKTYNGNPEMGSSWLIKMISHQGEVDVSDYSESSILACRSLEVGSKVVLTGVVAFVTYANGKVPNGLYLVDETSSIYIYSNEIAGRVAIGDKVRIAGVRDNYVLESEAELAKTWGYQGSIQLTSAIFVEKLAENQEFNKGWIKDSSVKKIIETPMSENITTEIYKVNAIINKAPGDGFVNYYIDDLDNSTGSYVYTLCNGSDFAYLDAYDGKICTVYLSAHNCKCAKSGTNYRFIPVLVELNENFSMSDENAIKFALEYYAAKQFVKEYNSDPKLELLESIDNEFIPFSGVEVTYNANESTLVTIAREEEKLVMHIAEGDEDVTLTMTGKYHDAIYSMNVTFTAKVIDLPETISLKDVIEATDDGVEVNVRGIAMSSLVNQTGFYLNDGTGVIAVRTSKATLENIGLGNEVVLKGTKTHVTKNASTNIGQLCIDNAELIANLLGNHEINDEPFVTGMTFEEIFALKYKQGEIDYTSTVFVTTCYLRKSSSAYTTNYYLTDSTKTKDYYLYAGSGGQYSDFEAFSDGRELTVAFMLCDWNTKSEYRACIVYASDGETNVLNTLNFK